MPHSTVIKVESPDMENPPDSIFNQNSMEPNG